MRGLVGLLLATALALAQRALLVGEDETARQPALWAPLILRGSP